jgi:hypothetical protein
VTPDDAAQGPRLDYVLPLRWSDDEGLDELAAYLHDLAALARVTVVDGSPEPLFHAHARAFGDVVRHVRPDWPVPCRNGKVRGVLTGVRLAESDKVVIADDDVRYDGTALDRVARLLDGADLVRPQNYFAPAPWHARWDTARSLLNRAVAGADYPGTYGLRRGLLLAVGGYDGNVLFENLELTRTVRAAGGREVRPLDLYVRRLPPSAAHFRGQRVRQAYDDFAQPWRLAMFLAVWPAAVTVVARQGTRGLGRVGAAALVVIGVAEAGRRRAGGARVFPATASLMAPLWVVERATCSWAALVLRLRGGVPYAGARVSVAAHSTWRLRRRTSHAAAISV